ncbi:hypothetical protein RDWZM_007055 [Blomia tropicalis]|uniref:deoxyribose-phosphate aldolase n=1 Tax=Blomia tropicalis TaxID=40697 RepID=A0A9Q0RMC2_BLOTA|nr:hypothetical protein BLOT_015551 [Blomia tropicalis]KAJ6221243.1 hypothetical protein RDWZM_007055 [Blomia tropicalis]
MTTFQFESDLLDVHLNPTAIKRYVERLPLLVKAQGLETSTRDLILAVQCIDLTTLAGDDTSSNVSRLCWRANNPLCKAIVDHLKKEEINDAITTAAVCVYPARVYDCSQYLGKLNSLISIASVVAGFPAGQGYDVCTSQEIKYAIESGACEIDIVINRTLALIGQWETLYEQIRTISQLCSQSETHLKVIISTGELATLTNVYKASMVAMMAGADFIKTSTGKESINAKLVYGMVMCRAIRDYHLATGRRVGLKPAGGLKNANDALCWIMLMRTQLGPDWLNNQRFRIGASSLLGKIEAELFQRLLKRTPQDYELSF